MLKLKKKIIRPVYNPTEKIIIIKYNYQNKLMLKEKICKK